jgi:hypothetical protein
MVIVGLVLVCLWLLVENWFWLGLSGNSAYAGNGRKVRIRSSADHRSRECYRHRVDQAENECGNGDDRPHKQQVGPGKKTDVVIFSVPGSMAEMIHGVDEFRWVLSTFIYHRAKGDKGMSSGVCVV